MAEHRKEDYSLAEGQQGCVIAGVIPDMLSSGETFLCFPHFSLWFQAHLPTHAEHICVSYKLRYYNWLNIIHIHVVIVSVENG